jgi:hypothetical protein
MIIKMKIFKNWIGQSLSCWSNIPYRSPTISKILSTSIKTSGPARTVTSSKGRQIATILMPLTFQLFKQEEEEEGARSFLHVLRFFVWVSLAADTIAQ